MVTDTIYASSTSESESALLSATGVFTSIILQAWPYVYIQWNTLVCGPFFKIHHYLNFGGPVKPVCPLPLFLCYTFYTRVKLCFGLSDLRHKNRYWRSFCWCLPASLWVGSHLIFQPPMTFCPIVNVNSLDALFWEEKRNDLFNYNQREIKSPLSSRSMTSVPHKKKTLLHPS